MKIWKPNGLSSLSLTTGDTGLPTEQMQPYQLFWMQSPCQCSTHNSTTCPTSLLFQWLFSTFPLLCNHQVIQKLLQDQKIPWLQPLLKILELYPWHLHSFLWEVLRVQPRNRILWYCLLLRNSVTPGLGSLGWRTRWGDNTLTCYHQHLPRKASPINTPPLGLCSHQKCYTRSSLALFANPVGKENKIYKDSIAINVWENEVSPKE